MGTQGGRAVSKQDCHDGFIVERLLVVLGWALIVMGLIFWGWDHIPSWFHQPTTAEIYGLIGVIIGNQALHEARHMRGE